MAIARVRGHGMNRAFLFCLLACSELAQATRGLLQQDLVLPDPQRPLTAPLDCSGWPEPRVYMEAQQWFTGPNNSVEAQSKHTHIGACVPYNQNISGVVTLDVLVQMHLMDDRTMPILSAVCTIDGGMLILDSLRVNLDCTTDQLTCKAVYRLRLDTTKVRLDGFFGIRLQGSPITRSGCFLGAEQPCPDADLSKGQGFGFNTMLEFQAYFSNGKPTDVQGSKPGRIMGRGTMTFPWHYTMAFLQTWPTAPVSGVLNLSAMFEQQSLAASITRVFASIDPSFHADPPVLGSIIMDMEGEGLPRANFKTPITIDTTQLSNGPHKLFLRCDVRVPDFALEGSIFPPSRPFQDSVNSGVLMLGFTVQN